MKLLHFFGILAKKKISENTKNIEVPLIAERFFRAFAPCCEYDKLDHYENR